MSLAKVLITFLFYIDMAIPEDVKISRVIPGGRKDKWKNGVDEFTLPPSVCRQWKQYCSSSACKTLQGSTSCSCSENSTTLIYHSNEWRCRKNTEVRTQLGCVENNMFRNEKTVDNLRTLNTQWQRQTNIKESDCIVNISSSWYVGCHGEKLPIAASDVFNLRWDSNRERCILKVQNVTSTNLFRGRVINLGINERTTACLLFKLEGHINCPADKPPEVASSTDNPSRVKISPTSTRPTPSAGIKLTHDDDNSSPPLGLIIGVTISIVAVSLLIAAFFFYRRHKSREDTYRNTSDPIKENTTEGRMQAKGVLQPEAQNGDVTNSNTDQRSSKSAGVYASLSVPEGHNMYGHISEHGQLNNTLQEHSLDNEEDGYCYGSITADPPVYHALEDQPSEYPEKSENNGPTNTDPVYNVLEETFPGGSERSECYGIIPVNEPFYNTLEESNSTDGPTSKNSEPVYNTLEESHPDENYCNDSRGLQDPVYNILESPVTNDMGSNISEGTNIPVYAVVNKKKK